MEYKEISNRPLPWLDLIRAGTKRFEGRVCKPPFWSKLQPGDRFILRGVGSKELPAEGGYDLAVEVVEMRFFADFGAAYRSLQGELVPEAIFALLDGGAGACSTVEDKAELVQRAVYSRYFSADDVAKYGVVCVGVKPV